MMTLTERQAGKLRPGESVVWCGKTYPPVWTLGVISEMAFGCFWCWGLFGHFKILRTVVDFWNRSEPLAVKIGITLFCVPFLCVGVSMVLSPLRRWLGGHLAVWCITNVRILRFGLFRTKSWGKDELFDEAPRHDHPDGRVDFLFSEHFVSGRGGGHVHEDVLERIPAEEAPLVAFALHGLTGAKSAWSDADAPAEDGEETPPAPFDPSLLAAPPPKHLTVVEDPSNPAAGVTLVYRKVSSMAFFLIVFTCFWSGISLFGLYGTQILARHFSLEKSLFGLPFALGTVGLLAGIVFALFGSRRLTLARGELRLWSGVGPFGRTRTLRLTRDTKVVAGFTDYAVNGRNLPELHLVSPGTEKPFRFLAGAPDDVRAYVRATLQRALAQA